MLTGSMSSGWTREFAQLEKIFEGESQPTFEYFADSKEVVVLSPPSPIHQHLQSAMERWFEDVGEELRDSRQSYYAENGCGKTLLFPFPS